MLTLTRKTDYALIALTHLAQEPGRCSSAREVAELYRLPLPLLMNVLKVLSQRELVQSVRGPRGGYTLAVEPADISLTQIIEAVEGPVHLTYCLAQNGHDAHVNHKGGCERQSVCPVRSSLRKVHDRLVGFLDTVTLADVVDSPPRKSKKSLSLVVQE